MSRAPNDFNAATPATRLVSLFGAVVIVFAAALAVSAQEKPSRTKEDPASVEELLQRVKDIEAELQRLRGGQGPLAQDASVALLLEDPYLGITNAHAETGIRYFAVRLVLINLKPQEMALPSEGIVLRTGGRTLSLRDRPGDVNNYHFPLGGQHVGIRDLTVPEVITLPASGTTSVVLFFAGLDKGPFIPEMELQIPLNGDVRKVDVNLYERGRLGLVTERIGPQGCLALLTVRGELNRINAGTLAAELDRCSEARLVRAVVSWESSAKQPEDFLRGWLQGALAPSQFSNVELRQMPGFPSSIRKLLIAAVPGMEGSADGTKVFATRAEAVREGLRSSFDNLPASEVIRSMKEGHELARAAALEFGVPRLGPEALPLVRRLASDASPPVQQAALLALQHFPQKEAVESLAHFALHGTPDQAEAAIHSLASSPHAASRQALLDLLPQELPVPGDKLIRILAAHPRPEWLPVIHGWTKSEQPEVRIEAVKALARQGHPDLVNVLAEALKSDSDALRAEAFNRLVERGDRESEELAMAYALRQLEQGTPTGAVFQFLKRTRDQRAVPLLLKLVPNKSAVRREVIGLLIEIGDQTVIEGLAESFASFAPDEQSEVLKSLTQLESPFGRELALRVLRSENSEIFTQAINLLRFEKDDEVVSQLGTVLEATKNNSVRQQICNAWAAIATPLAKQKLQAAKKSEIAELRDYATRAYQALRQQSPANTSVTWAQRFLVEGKLDEARKQLAIAEKIDPTFPDLYIERADLHLRDNKSDAAIADARKAVELDDGYERAHLALGSVLERLEQTDEAIESMRRAIQVNDRYAEAHLALGKLLFKLQRHEEAIPSLRRAVELARNDHEAVTTLAIALAVAGDMNEGIELVGSRTKQFENAAGFPVYLYNVACVYGRALERVRKDPATAADDPRIEKFGREAIGHLQRSMEAGVEGQAATSGRDMANFMWEDPDLKSLHELPEFRKLARVDESTGKPAPAPETPPTPQPQAEPVPAPRQRLP